MIKMIKKSIALLLILSICFSLLSMAFATDAPEAKMETVDSAMEGLSWELYPIVLEDGSVIEIEVPVDPEPIDSERSLTPEYPVGTIKSIPINIKNEQLLVPITIGGAVGYLAKQRLAT